MDKDEPIIIPNLLSRDEMKEIISNLYWYPLVESGKEFLDWLEGIGFFETSYKMQFHFLHKGAIKEYSLHIYLLSDEKAKTFTLYLNHVKVFNSVIVCDMGHDWCTIEIYKGIGNSSSSLQISAEESLTYIDTAEERTAQESMKDWVERLLIYFKEKKDIPLPSEWVVWTVVEGGKDENGSRN